MKAFLNFLYRLFFGEDRAERIVGGKTIAQIIDWLETHGIERSTAAQIMGFLTAYGVNLGQIKLCSYGLTYSFEEFIEWWKTPQESMEPKENYYAIFWDDVRGDAIIGIFKIKSSDNYYDTAGNSYSNACIFRNFAEYRMILNTPDDMDIPLPLTHLLKHKEDSDTKVS